jgi:type II secretory pathway component PulJ
MTCPSRRSPIADRRLPIAFHRRRRAGLTVLELVSALALFVIILGMLFVALNGATDIWSHDAAQSKGLQAMRRVQELMADDLTCAVGAPRTDESDKPWFIIDYPAARTNQCGLYFVKALSPRQVTGDNMRSLELVGYLLATDTNVLYRYTASVSLNTDVGDQLSTFFQSTYGDPASQTNARALSACITTFGVVACTNKPPATAFNLPGAYDNTPGQRVSLYSLPDFVDIGIAYTNRNDSAKGDVPVYYLTRRVAFPTAPASRSP